MESDAGDFPGGNRCLMDSSLLRDRYRKMSLEHLISREAELVECLARPELTEFWRTVWENSLQKCREIIEEKRREES